MGKILINQTKTPMFNEQLRKRTMNMACDTRKVLLGIEIGSIDRPIVNQLIRSSSSVAANYRAATRALSDSEFFAKICIVTEEADETLFWLEYLILIQLLDGDKIASLLDEIDQLVRLFVKIKRKMAEKLEKGRKERKS
ncbi:MAG: four helix bundle protein [Bacteroidetes bacterium]|nr:four helix bundle protein [Bacteroidota bacterium]